MSAKIIKKAEFFKGVLDVLSKKAKNSQESRALRKNFLELAIAKFSPDFFQNAERLYIRSLESVFFIVLPSLKKDYEKWKRQEGAAGK